MTEIKTKEYKVWLIEGVSLNIHLRVDMSNNNYIDTLYDNLGLAAKIKQMPHFTKEALNCVVANLYSAFIEGKSLKINLNKNRYPKFCSRYGNDWYTYRRMNAIITSLAENEYIHINKGYYDKVKKDGYLTRVMLSAKMLDEIPLEQHKLVKRHSIKEVIILRDSDGMNMDYEDTDFTNTERDILNQINSIMKQFKITFTTTPDAFKEDVSNGYIQTILNLYSSGYISSDDINLDEVKNPLKQYSSISTIPNTIEPLIYPNSTPYIPNIIQSISYNNIINIYSYIIILTSFTKYINYTIENSELFRVFNRGSFSYGGRFYGAVHMNIPKVFRQSICIDGEPTVELDYSGLHIRMLYHLLGKEFDGECYVYSKSDKANKVKRDLIKLISLAAINASSKLATLRAVYASNEHDRKKDYRVPYISYSELEEAYDTFILYHSGIKEYISSDKGIELQNIDSAIIRDILTQLIIDNNIPALPVHDSVICRQSDKKLLYQMMINIYSDLIGHTPIVD